MKIAIVKLSAMGDIVHAMAALQFIKAQIPDAEIDWLVEAGFAGVLADNPDINQILPVNIKALKKHKAAVFSEIAQIRRYAQQNYDRVIDAQGLVKSAIVTRLLSSNNAGFDKASIREPLAASFYKKTVNCAYDENTIIRNMTVLSQPLGLQISPEQLAAKQPFLFFQTPKETLLEN